MPNRLKPEPVESRMPAELRRYLETCNPMVLISIWNYLDGDPRALDEMICLCAKRADADAHKKVNSAPEPSYNQHPMYETWKGMCPKCNERHAKHVSGSREYEVQLQCTDCGHVFTLKEGFEAQLARQKPNADISARREQLD